MVGEVERPIVLTRFQLTEKVFFVFELFAQTLLFPLAVNGENLRDLGIVADDVGGFLINQHIDFALGEMLFDRIDDRRTEQYVTMMAQFDDEDTFGLCK